MSLSATPIHVRVDKRPEESFRQTIHDICSWLDQHAVQPVVFEPVATRESGVGFELSFDSEDEAASFQQQFTCLHARRLRQSQSEAKAVVLLARAAELECSEIRPSDPAADVAAIHEFRQGMTATINYLAGASCLLTASSGPNHETLRKALKEALFQAERASQAVIRLHGSPT